MALRKVCFCLILGQIDRLYQKHSASMQRKGADLCMSSIYADGVLASAAFFARAMPQVALVQSAVFVSKL